MDNLPAWALWLVTVAVGLGPGLAILSARPIARLLHRALSPHDSGHRPVPATAVVAAPECEEPAQRSRMRRLDGALTATAPE
jgi:hypothetical protein